MGKEERELLKHLVRLVREAIEWLEFIAGEISPFKDATTAVVSLGGPMPLTVGGTTTAILTFQDANGDTAEAPTGDGSGLSVTFNSSDVTVATVDAGTLQSDGTYLGVVTGVGEGTYQINAAVENTSGAALVDDDGTTAFVQPAAVEGTVGAAPAGQAVTAVITLA